MFRSRTRFYRRIAIALIAFHVAGLASSAAPLGGSVVSGQADITAAGGITQIRQETDRAVINWQSFSSKAGEAVRFQQPSATSVTLNRVVTLDPSVLNGSLTANGRLFLINPNGIVFGPTSQVNVGSLVASTLSISDHDFQRGNYRLVQAPDRPLASIINQGKITASPGGMVALVAPVVNNQGEIVAAAGRVVLAGGAAAQVDLDAGLVSLDVSASPPRDVVAGTDGAANPLAEAVNNRALVEAGSVTEQGGKVVLGSAEGLVVNTGRICVDGPSGGRVKLDSTQATVHAGRGVIRANATAAGGAGGEIKVLGQKTTAFGRGARIEARGGAKGGFAEVSGASIILQGQVDVSAPQGQAGSFLIDPQQLTIVDAAGTLDGCAPPVNPGQTATLELSACCGANTISVARLNDIAASCAHVELQVGCSLTFNNTADIFMEGLDFTIRFVGTNGAGVIQKTTSIGVGAIVNAGNVSFLAGQTKATAFDLTNLAIGAVGTVLICAPSAIAPPVVRLGLIGTGGGCNPQQVTVNAPRGLIAGGGSSTGAPLNIRATSVNLDAAQIGTSGADGVRIDVSGIMKLKADDKMFVANDAVPAQLDVTLDQPVAGQVAVQMGGGGANALVVCTDGLLGIDAVTGLDVLLAVTRGGNSTVATRFGALNVGPGGALAARVTGEAQFQGSVRAPGGRIGFRANRLACRAGACGGFTADQISIDAGDSIGFGAGGDGPLAFAATTALDLAASGQKVNATLRTLPAVLSIAVQDSTEVHVLDTCGAALVSRAPLDAFVASVDTDLSLEVFTGDLVAGGIDVGGHEVVLTALDRLLTLPGTRIQGDRVTVCAPGGVGGILGCGTAPVVDVDANVLGVTANCGAVFLSDPDDVFVDHLDALGAVELTVGGNIDTDVAGITGASIDVRARGNVLGAFVATNFVALASTTGCVGTDANPVVASACNAVALAACEGGITAFVGGAPPSLDVTAALGKPVDIREASKFSIPLIRTDGDFFLETAGPLDTFLTLRGATDLRLGDLETTAGFAVALFAPNGEIRTATGSTIIADAIFVSTRDGMHAGSGSAPTASLVSTGELSVAVTGNGSATLLADGDVTLRAASSCDGSIDVEALGNLTVDSVNNNETFGSVTGTVRLAANEAGGQITVAACDTIIGRRVIMEADDRIDVDHVNAVERAQFRIGNAGVLLADLDALPRQLRLIQDVASGADIAVQFGAQFVTGAAGGALSASMAVDLVLETDAGDLRVADVDMLGRALTLDAAGGAIRSTPGSRLRANDVTLIADRGPGAPAGSAIEAVVEARAVSICTTRGDARVQVVAPVVDLKLTDVDGDLFVSAAGALGIADDVTATGLVQLTAAGAIADTDPVRAKVAGARAELFAGAGAGTPDRPLVTDVDVLDVRGGAAGAFVVNDGALSADATAGTDVFVMTRTGDLTVQAVNAGFTAQLVAGGRILDGNGNADNVTLGAGGNLLLRAGSGIGTLANPLEIATDAVDASTRTGDIALSERDHVLVKAAAGDDVAITARGGYLILDTIAAGGRAALTAVIGGILDANGTAVNVTARELLVALCDTAGTSADFLEIAVRKVDVTAFGAFLDAQGALEVERLQSTGSSQILAQGDLKLGRLESTQGKMDLVAAGGDILDGNGGGVNLVSGSNGLSTLTATGTIGAGNALEVSLNPGFLSVLAGAAQGGVSASIEGDIVPASSVLVVGAPGSVLFRGRVQGDGAVDGGAVERVNAGQVVAGANRAPQSQGSGQDKPQKENELIDASGVQ